MELTAFEVRGCVRVSVFLFLNDEMLWFLYFLLTPLSPEVKQWKEYHWPRKRCVLALT